MKHFQSDRIRNKDFFYFQGPFFNSTTYLAFMSVCVFDHFFDPLPIKLFKIYAQIWTPWVKADLMKHCQSDRIRNKDFFYFQGPFFNSTTYLAFMSVCVFDHFFDPLPIKLFQI